ncbi:MAG: alpha/beta hydrolase-fold protein [bacterium]
MIRMKMLPLLTAVFLGCCHLCIAQSTPKRSTEIHLNLSAQVSDTALSGRVYVMFDRNVYSQPLRNSMPDESSAWFAVDVDNWRPGAEYVLAGEVDSYPYSLAELPPGDYAVQAVFDINTTDFSFSEAPGNIYSDAVAALIREEEKSVVSLSLEHQVEQKEILETGFIKEIKVESRLLSDFLGRPTSVKGMVILPPSYYRSPEQEYATVFVMPGFGTGYADILAGNYQFRRYGMNSVGREKLFVFLDQQCPLGYHVFANSENNGPWATAFVEEFIPYLEKSYRVYRDPATRFLTGQSSGAWAGLWLQINYPDQFGGVWACSPDPVDFESILGVNIYKPNANLLYDDAGAARELNKFLSDVDRVIGDGWALSTFEAVFSPRGQDGHPHKLWDRETGVIDAAVAEAWKDYDLRFILKKNQATLAPQLAGKIHIYVAENDRFGLDDPVKSLQQALAGTNYDLEIVIFDEGGHDVWTDALRQQIHRGMDERIALAQPAPGE